MPGSVAAPEVDPAALRSEADREVARRARAGAFGHLFLLVVAAVATPLRQEHPWLLLACGIPLLCSNVLRLQAASVHPATYAATVIWTVFSGAVLAFYGQSDTGMLVALMTGAVATAATNSLSPDLPMMRRVVAVLAGGTIVPCLVGWTPAGERMAILTFAFASYLVLIGTRQHETWARAHIANARLALRTIELEEARAAEQAAVAQQLASEAALREAQKMQAVGRLAAGIAHDFNNLLTVILGHCSLLLESVPAGGREHDEVEEIEKSARLASELTSQLLGFSRQQVLAPRPVCANDLLQALADMLGRALGEHIHIALDLAPDRPWIQVDPNRMQQVLLNLVMNARDAMPEGGTVTLFTRRDERGVVLGVRDTGSGIAPEIRQQIYEPFFTTKAAGEGTGLGLSMVWGIVEQSGGEIEFDTEVGKGTEFRIHLPATAPIQAPHLPAGDGAMEGKETILIAEDQPSLRRLMRRLLAVKGYAVVDAPDGEGALAALGELGEPVDLLITDMVMPGGMTGGELAQRVKSLHPKVRVLFISGYTQEGLELDNRTEFLAKPFMPEKLLNTVRGLLDAA